MRGELHARVRVALEFCPKQGVTPLLSECRLNATADRAPIAREDVVLESQIPIREEIAVVRPIFCEYWANTMRVKRRL
jgi:hypothetical protein